MSWTASARITRYIALLAGNTHEWVALPVVRAQAKPAGSPGKAARAAGGKAPAKADKSAPKDLKAAPAPK